MTFKPKAYPFPVLQPDFPNYKDSEYFSVSFEIRLNDEHGIPKQTLSSEVQLKNDAIEALILDGKLMIGAELFCKATLERRLLDIGMGVNPVDLSDVDLLDAVSVTPVIVVREPIPNFNPTETVVEFEHLANIQLFQGDVLAYGVTKYFDVSLDHNAQPDLVRVEPISGQPDYWFDFQLDGPVITIQVSQEIMKFWQKLKQDHATKPYLYTNIYKDCLTEAIDYLKNNDGSEQLWCKVLSNQIVSIGGDLASREPRDLANQLVYKYGFGKVVAGGDAS